MRSRAIPTLLLVLLLATFTSTAAAQDSGRGVVLRVGLGASENNLNPFLPPQAQPLTHDLTMLVYDTLFWSQSRLDPEPWLATGAEPSEDLRTWTVSLRDDVTWHDGQPFTASDVAFTFQYFNDDRGPGRYGHHVYIHPVFESATVIDDTTVQLSFANPVPAFKLLPGGDLPILPKHIWEAIEDPRADTTSLPVGTGPYKMVDYQPDSSYRLEANQTYFLGAPLVDALEFSVVPDDQAAFGALEAGELDFIARNVPVAFTDQIERNPDLDIIGGSRLQSVYLQYNLGGPVLGDQRVRQAVGLALDVHVMLDVVEGGQGRLGTDTWTHPNSPWTRDPTGAHLSDQAAASQLLDAAGYTMAGDGARVGPDGLPVVFTLGVNGSLPTHVRTAELVAEQLQPLGLNVELQLLDATAISGASGDSAGGPPAVDMLIGERESHGHDDPDHLFFLFHSTSGVDDAFTNYANPALDAVVEDALDEPLEGSARLDLINAAQDILAQDLPAVVLYYPAGRMAYRPAAYDGWTSDEGHGVFTKRSFLAPYADVGEDAHLGPRPEVPAFEPPEAGGRGLGRIGIAGITIAALAAAGALGLTIRSRLAVGDTDDDRAE